MNIEQKLQLIIELLGLTQVALASKLGVSFVTLNRWINSRSVPHKSKQRQIDALFRELYGGKVIPDSALQVKKDILKQKSKKHKNILQILLKNPDIREQLILSLTYNSNGIEGSTLSEADTSAIIFDGISLKNKTVKEHLEAKNHQATLEYVFNTVKADFKISGKFILKLHGILMNSILDNAGSYRQHGVRIVGANVPTANYLKIPILMQQLEKELNKKEQDVIAQVARIHSKFEQIHPFPDGNGRIGRLLILAVLLKNNYAPAILEQKTKRDYLKFLNKSQVRNDFIDFENYLCDAIIRGFSLFER